MAGLGGVKNGGVVSGVASSGEQRLGTVRAERPVWMRRGWVSDATVLLGRVGCCKVRFGPIFGRYGLASLGGRRNGPVVRGMVM